MQIDISIQDQRHYGLRCVELVKTFLKDYDVLEPIVLALKNILKLAGLNDPYTGGLSSYGLILMVVSFLQVLNIFYIVSNRSKKICQNGGFGSDLF